VCMLVYATFTTVAPPPEAGWIAYAPRTSGAPSTASHRRLRQPQPKGGAKCGLGANETVSADEEDADRFLCGTTSASAGTVSAANVPQVGGEVEPERVEEDGNAVGVSGVRTTVLYPLS
jgi:hypothetical protein